MSRQKTLMAMSFHTSQQECSAPSRCHTTCHLTDCREALHSGTHMGNWEGCVPRSVKSKTMAVIFSMVVS